ncbi:MAG: PEP-CTERM sorting domain-containing protein [Kiritimatiellales bacterium]
MKKGLLVVFVACFGLQQITADTITIARAYMNVYDARLDEFSANHTDFSDWYVDIFYSSSAIGLTETFLATLGIGSYRIDGNPAPPGGYQTNPATIVDNLTLSAQTNYEFIYRVYTAVDAVGRYGYLEITGITSKSGVAPDPSFTLSQAAVRNAIASNPDLAWTIIPEPAAVLLMFVGGVLTWVSNRRKKLHYAL